MVATWGNRLAGGSKDNPFLQVYIDNKLLSLSLSLSHTHTCDTLSVSLSLSLGQPPRRQILSLSLSLSLHHAQSIFFLVQQLHADGAP